jgi:hypothetical protein
VALTGPGGPAGLTPDDLTLAASVCRATLEPAASAGAPADWTATAGELDWDCRRTLDHLPDTLLLYSAMLATRAERGLATDIRGGDPSLGPAQLLDLVDATAAVLADVARAAPPGARALHPAGLADAEGFVAMGCDELLVHTGDIASGLGLAYDPPGELCARLLARLFPWAPEPGTSSAWTLLAWANGRVEVPGLDPARWDHTWYWHCAPLAEWDGTVGQRIVPSRWR